MEDGQSGKDAQNDSSQEDPDARFGKFLIPAVSIFYRSQQQHLKQQQRQQQTNNHRSEQNNNVNTIAFVNLRPIVPGHVLIMPERIVPQMSDLSDMEYTDVWMTVRRVQRILTQHYQCDAFNVAVQDGRAAGQSVPHVHVHILPRYTGDLERNDDIYDALEHWAPRDELKVVDAKITVPDDAGRKDRTPEQMANEAATYRNLLQQMQQQDENSS